MSTRVGIRGIMDAVARRHGVSIIELTSDRQGRDAVGPRHLAMWLARRQGHSYRAIGAAFRRDHTSVLYAVGKMRKLQGDVA